MAVSDAILQRLLALHPKIIDLSLERMHRILARLGHPERNLPAVIHVAGTNGKGSCVAYLRAIIEAAGLKAHCYTSPHLVKFHERIRLAGTLIAEDQIAALLEECEQANGGAPITFFEITTAAAFLAFAREPADYLILEVGLGGRLDATNVVTKPAATIVTSIGLDHQQYLGETIDLIAREKAGILKTGVAGILGPMPMAARAAIESVAERIGAPLTIANQDWQSYEQHGRLVFQDEQGLLDVPLPNLLGAHQIDNAGNAIAAIRSLQDNRISEAAIASGITTAEWPARLQRLSGGTLSKTMEVWLDGGHNPDAGLILARHFKALSRKSPRPLTIVWGMLNSKDAREFFRPLAPLASKVITLSIPGEPNAIPGETLSDFAHELGCSVDTAASLEQAFETVQRNHAGGRILICGSLYLAGHVLAQEQDQVMSEVSGAARR